MGAYAKDPSPLASSTLTAIAVAFLAMPKVLDTAVPV